MRREFSTKIEAEGFIEEGRRESDLKDFQIMSLAGG